MSRKKCRPTSALRPRKSSQYLHLTFSLKLFTHTHTLAFVKCKQKCLVWCLFCLCDFTYRFRLCLSPLHAPHTPTDKEWERERERKESGKEWGRVRERDEDSTQREKYHNYMPRHRIPKQMRNLPAAPALTKHFARFYTFRLYGIYMHISRIIWDIETMWTLAALFAVCYFPFAPSPFRLQFAVCCSTCDVRRSPFDVCGPLRWTLTALRLVDDVLDGGPASRLGGWKLKAKGIWESAQKLHRSSQRCQMSCCSTRITAISVLPSWANSWAVVFVVL